MKKDAYYFPHYSNARHDRKIKRIIKELGVEGYGIFFMLLEVLREQTDFRYPIEDIDLLADEFGTSEQKVRTVISNYKLFDIDENELFFSPKLIFYLQPYIERTERARAAANARWSNANALPEHSVSNAKERRGKERREEINNIYKAYPSKCVVKGSSTGKSSKDKDKIESLLKEYTSDELLNKISLYVDECKSDGRFMKNFKTFLNNLPDTEDPENTHKKNKIRHQSFDDIMKKDWERLVK